MLKPFHLSIVVADMALAKSFYVDFLGCTIGRDNTTWFDILFYGHQVTIHQENDRMPAVAINHFGPILDKEAWLLVVERCGSSDIDIVLTATIRNEGERDESGKFIIKDPCNNIIEFKYYSNFSESVG